MNANRVILSKKKCSSVFKTKAGVEVPTDYTFTEILAVQEKSLFKVGDIACIKTNKLNEEIPYEGDLEYICLDYDILYSLPNEEEAKDTSH